jgi:uncharacterized membrane protein YhhN
MPLKKYALLFLLLLATDVTFLLLGWQTGHFVAKILLMPVLMVALIQAKRKASEKNWHLILGGLVMAWAGDVLLLFAATSPVFFILGLVFFLCTHLVYIFYFSKYHTGILNFVSKHWAFTLSITVYSITLLAVLWPHLGGLLLPVIA